MAYTKQVWVDDDQTKPLSAARMGYIEQGIADAHALAEAGGGGGALTAGSVSDTHVSATAAIQESKLALASDAAAGTASRRSLGTGATQAAAGNDARLSDTRTPSTGSVVNASVSATAAIAESKLALASDAAQGTPSRRTISTALPLADGTAAAGVSTAASASDHVHPSSGGGLSNGSVTDVHVSATAAIQESKLALASDAAAGTASRRTLGTGATQAAAGNDARLSDTRTPTDLSVTNAKVSATAAIAESKLALASDAAAATASRRTLGTGALQAAAGNDSRFPAGADIVNADISATAAIAESKLALASDAAATTASRRTLGTGALQAAPGDHAHAGGGGLSAGSVEDSHLSTTNLTVLTRQIMVTTVDAARPVFGGPVTWFCDYSPFTRPTNAIAGDSVIDAFGVATPAGAVNSLHKMMAADQSTTAQTATLLADLFYDLKANKSYEFEAMILVQSAATTNGFNFGLIGPLSPDLVHATFEYQTSDTAWATKTLRALGLMGAVASVPVANTTHLVRVKGIIQNGANAGQFGITFASEVGTSAVTVRKGSILKVVAQN